jgi:hypothetical protein
MIVWAIGGSSSAQAGMAHDSPAAINTLHRAPDIHAESVFMSLLRKVALVRREEPTTPPISVCRKSTINSSKLAR